MLLDVWKYHPRTGWSQPFRPDLDGDRTLVIVFGASSYLGNPGPLEALRGAFPRAHLIGCSTAGEIHDTALEDESLVAAALRFEWTELATVAVPVAGAGELYSAGRDIAQRLDRPGLRGILVLSDGQNVNGSDLVRGLNSVLPPSVTVTGGLAGDGARFERTWVIHGGRPSSGVVAAVGFYGDRVRLSYGSMGGWDIFGPEREVTRSVGNVLYELSGRPALELYEAYLGDLAAGLPASALLFPLSLRLSKHDAKHIVRTVLSVDRSSQSLTFAGDIPEGCLARLMQANPDRLIEGAAVAGSQASRSAADPEGSPDPFTTLSIAISCVGRRLVLGERTEEELEATLEALPTGTRQVGFYSYGEISPHFSGFCDLHNQTMTVTTIGER